MYCMLKLVNSIARIEMLGVPQILNPNNRPPRNACSSFFKMHLLWFKYFMNVKLVKGIIRNANMCW